MARIPVDVRRKALVEAAFRVVAARGLREATTRAIVTEAGMSLASFHYAFESRDELIDRLILDVVAKEEKALILAECDGKTLAELLADGLKGYLDHLRADPNREQAMLELTHYSLRTRVDFAQQQYAQYMRIGLTSLTTVTEFTDSRWTVPLSTVARILIAFTDGLTLNWLVTRDDPAIEAAIEATARAVASLAEPLPMGRS